MVEVLLSTDLGRHVSRYLFASGETIHVPHVLDLEVLQALRRYSQAARISALRAEQRLSYYRSMPLNRYPHDILAPRIWALRHNLTAYDASYIALAESLDAPLITCDRAFAAASGHTARILLL
jgi:predicted nucleic acid-binding protein